MYARKRAVPDASEVADGDLAALLDEPDEAAAAEAVAAEMTARPLLRALTEEEIEQREFDAVLRELERSDREQRRAERERMNAISREEARRAEAVAAQRRHAEELAQASRERMARQASERAAQADRERLARLEQQLATFSTAPTQAAQREAWGEQLRRRWARIEDAFAPFLHKPAPNGADERVAALEFELAAREEREAADAETRRHQKYMADQRAAIARRESGE